MFDNHPEGDFCSHANSSAAANAISDELTFPAAVEPCCKPGSVLRYTVEDQRTVYDRGSIHGLNERDCLGQEEDSVHTCGG